MPRIRPDDADLRHHKRRRRHLNAGALAVACLICFVAASLASAASAKHAASKSNVPILDPEGFQFECNDSNSDGLHSMHSGVIKVCLPLPNEGGGHYARKYDKYGFPLRVTIYLPAGATFSAKVKIHGWSPEYPRSTKPTRADKTWKMVKVGGVMRPRLFIRHFLPSQFATSLITIKLTGNPASACVRATAVAPGVKGAPKQTIWGTFYDPSSGAPPPTILCGG